ncbi:MAG: two-component system, NarL family, sensor kinase [bacterium]
MGLRSGRRRAAGAPPRVDSAVARFMLGSILAIAVIVVGGFVVLRGIAVTEAKKDTLDRVQSLGRIVELSGLRDSIVRRNPAAITHLDDVVQTQVLSDSIVRVKLWTRSGTILYSDVPALMGRHFGLGPEELELFRNGKADSELSDLRKPENQFERQEGQLLEAYTVIRAPDGTPLLFEIYETLDSTDASASSLLAAIAPPLIAGVIVLVLLQMPLAWSMARRLQRGHHEREALLSSAVEASSRERRRIAADLHDGVVQDIAGVAFGLAPLAAGAARRGDEAEAGVLREATGTLRQGVRDLRTLLVEIHPPNLDSAGLRVALSDLLSPLEKAGIATSLEVDEAATGNHDALVYRAAREAIRNARRHAQPQSVRVAVTCSPGGSTRLVVADDGEGFSAQARERRGEQGHLGLTLLEEVVTQAGGTLTVRSAPGKGTTIEMQLPAR